MVCLWLFQAKLQENLAYMNHPPISMTPVTTSPCDDFLRVISRAVQVRVNNAPERRVAILFSGIMCDGHCLGALAIILTGWLTVLYPQADWTLPC